MGVGLNKEEKEKEKEKEKGKVSRKWRFILGWRDGDGRLVGREREKESEGEEEEGMRFGY